jgi:hypothetical protein
VSSVGTWNIDSLKEHLEAVGNEREHRHQERFEAQENAMHSALVAAKEAVVTAQIAVNERLTLLNEFRSQSKDEQARFASRSEVEAALDRLTERNQETMAAVANCLTRSEMITAEARYAERLHVLETRANLNEGKSTGYNASYLYAIAFIGVAVSIITVYLTLRH